MNGMWFPCGSHSMWFPWHVVLVWFPWPFLGEAYVADASGLLYISSYLPHYIHAAIDSRQPSMF